MKKILTTLFLSSLFITSYAQWIDGGPKITTTQNVGIGTSSPDFKLDILGNLRITVPGSKTPISGVDISVNSFSTPENAANSYYLRMRDVGAGVSVPDVFIVKGNRNIGIGTNTPTQRLDVVGNIRANNIILPWGQMTLNTDDNFTYQNKSMGNYAICWNSDSWHTGASTLWQSGYGGIKLFTHATVRLAINKEGNVGIGTDNPQNKLDVLGTIRATEVKVEAGWADFVFDKDYKLPTLQEVENHINEHKHLPDIPSEAEVKENGVSLGEMQAKLLQKIEELTLYVIKLKKENQEQSKLIHDLQGKLE